MKPKKLRRIVREIYDAVKIDESGTVAVSIACHAAYTGRGIDSRAALRALGATCLGMANVDSGSGTKVISGTVYVLPPGRYLRVDKKLVLDISEATDASASRVVDDLLTQTGVIDHV